MKHNYQKPTVDAVQLTTKHASFQMTSVKNNSRKYSGSIVDDEQPEEEQ